MFSSSTALAHALLCQASYAEDAPERLAALLRIGRAAVTSDLDDGHAVYACATQDATVLVFRGSATAQDWLTDAEASLASQSPYPGRVHWGFARMLDNCWPWILSSTPPMKPVIVTGHSLGAATGCLAAHRLKATQSVADVYTFGQPRTGDWEFAAGYGPTLWRVVNRQDLVTQLPLPIGWKHAGNLKQLDGQGGWAQPGVLVYEVMRQAVRMLRNVPGELMRQRDEHGIGAYVSALAGLRVEGAEMGGAA